MRTSRRQSPTPLSSRQSPARTRRPKPAALTAAGALALSGALAAPVAASASPAASAASPAAAAGAPARGTSSHFDLARKDCVGTAQNGRSKVWFTVADGVLSDVYWPTIDNTEVETLQYVVTDGSSFTDLQTRDTTYTVRTTDVSGMSCEVTSTSKAHGYKLVTEYVTDPKTDAVVMHTKLVTSRKNLSVYVRYDATVNGNGGGGEANAGGDTATYDASRSALVASDTSTATQAVNRDYAKPVYAALAADRPFTAVRNGYAGTASDGLTELDATHGLASNAAPAADGNVVQTGRIALSAGKDFTLALGYDSRNAGRAAHTAWKSARTPFASLRGGYLDTWHTYDAKLNPPPATLPGQSAAAAAQAKAQYWLSVNVLKASEDKTFRGAVVASLASPWGQALDAGARDANTGLPVWFGSYREIFARDLYEAFTGFLAAGDTATEQAIVRWLFQYQQQPDGRFPRNSLLNGQKNFDSAGDQLDESAFPILAAWQAGLGGDSELYTTGIKPAADFVVAHGPSFGNERWEEQSGYSPSTIAAEIGGLVAAAKIADQQGDSASARLYRATADSFQRQIKAWTVTTTGTYGNGRYFIRLSKNGNPDEAVSYGLGNGSVTADQRSVLDGGFLELTRLGILSPNDPDVRATVPLLDKVISRSMPTGRGYYRYGTSTPGSEDGYGDCWVADPTNCPVDGQPWPTSQAGSGHVWPVLSGERGEDEIARGVRTEAAKRLRMMIASSSGVGLVPEQAWEDPSLPKSPYGTDPAIASIGFQTGKAAGSASPLTWAQAQEVRLARAIATGTVVEQPAAVKARYLHGAVAAVPVTITSPANATEVTGATTTVTGTTAPGATVTVQALLEGSETGATDVVVTAGSDGSFSADVPTGPGTTDISAAAELAGATGVARVTVVSSFIPGTTVLDVTDPTGDDNGPGTYAYPLAADFHAGAYDLRRFEVIDSGDTVTLRSTLGDLTPTFGSPIGAQLLDIYVQQPGGGTTSTSPGPASRNFTIDPGSAWTKRLEIQGFVSPVFIDAAGTNQGAVTVISSSISKTIAVVIPKAALGGTPGAGWKFTVALHGQDGFSPDQARGFQPLPQDYQFGLCASASVSSPICSIDPGTAPKVMDVLTPAGVSQATELDPTQGPVRLQGVPVS
ncbi:glucan 1,4-alpha-glucosidase [Motilibacter peucedani]|uniref:Glucan 1,4-alpha-glucosidase n=1 Tax=Motilibacter peucedani TaxID=598650 RepID=A0A420XRT5_9ACTN|nr:glucodextranase DOMON-like domain-containing protein [Motilibacter peucedani]RKS77521.1 glucan 1,4-alpha-glucosidase [Motilibacter peucedani]